MENLENVKAINDEDLEKVAGGEDESGTRTYMCNICGRICKDLTSLYMHMQIAHRYDSPDGDERA